MSTRTFCDRCGSQCQGKVFRVHVSATELTAQGQPVSQEEYHPLDLCQSCGELHAMTLAPDMRIAFSSPVPPFSPDAMAWAPSPVPAEDVP